VSNLQAALPSAPKYICIVDCMDYFTADWTRHACHKQVNCRDNDPVGIIWAVAVADASAKSGVTLKQADFQWSE
jgi:hypothetical protein